MIDLYLSSSFRQSLLKAGISAVLADPGDRSRSGRRGFSRLPLSIHFDGASGRRLSPLVDPPFGEGPRGLVP